MDEAAPKPTKKWWRWALFLAAGLVIAALAVDELYLVDLRPATLRLDELPPALAQQGEAILAEAAKAHGLGAWESHEVLDITFTDTWHGALVQRFYMTWAHSPQKIHAQFLRDTWTSRYEFLDGPKQGHIWGLQSWQTYTIKPGQEVVFDPDASLEFTLPTVQYFFELPFRMGSGSVIADAGAARFNDRLHHRVFITWESLAPTEHLDQYVVWVDQESHLITRTDYTVRDQGGFVSGSSEYSDFRDVGGVQLAFLIQLFALAPGGNKVLIHEMKVDEAAWDQTELAVLRPDPELPLEGDAKPSTPTLDE